MPARIISVGTNKGGAGKSALAMFIALVSAYKGKKTVVLDADSQCGLSFRIKGAESHLRRGFVRSIVRDEEIPVKDFLIGENLSFVPGDLSAERWGEGDIPSHAGRRLLDELLSRFDVAVIDSGPRPTAFEKQLLAKGDVHLLPGGSDKASIVGVVYRMVAVIDLLGSVEREKFFFIPWGVNLSEKTGKNARLMEHITGVMQDFGMSITPPFPPVPDMTDLICTLEDGVDMANFLKYPGIARRKKDILQWGEDLWGQVEKA